MAKPDHLFDHLNNPAFRDPPSPVAVAASPGRLCHALGACRGDWQTVAGLIAGPRRWPVAWFPDANVAFLPQAEAVWDALRVAGLGAAGGVAALSAVVLAEMREWLDQPYRLKDRAGAIRAALEGRTWLRALRFAPASPLATAAYGYMHLLGLRRFLARPLADGTSLVGTDAADKSRTMNAIKDKVGPRAQGLARKGRIDAEGKGVVSVSDELHCLMVIANAVANGLDSVILTADEDLVEIFYKAQWFFDTHYRAWLAARLIKEGRYGGPVGEVADTRGYFDGPLTLYRRTTTHLREVLPAAYEPVRVGVVYVAPHGELRRVAFPFERQMLGMLRTRAATGGRCTDLFGDANLHVDLGPLKPVVGGLCLGVGRDAGAIRGTGDDRAFLARMDQAHALNCFERYVRR